VERKNEEMKSTIPLELHGFYKTGKLLDTPLIELLNNSICIKGKHFNLPEFAIQQIMG
jgi:hypothetical protein